MTDFSLSLTFYVTIYLLSHLISQETEATGCIQQASNGTKVGVGRAAETLKTFILNRCNPKLYTLSSRKYSQCISEWTWKMPVTPPLSFFFFFFCSNTLQYPLMR